MAKKTANNEKITLDEMNLQTVELSIRGFCGPLVVHAWSQKALIEMLQKQLNAKIGKKKEPKDPERQYRESMYIIDRKKGQKERYGFPCNGFKDAIVRATKILKDTKQMSLDMIAAKQIIFVLPDGIETRTVRVPISDNDVHEEQTVTELVEIIGTPNRRMDCVRVSNGAADIRFRGEFREWKANLKIQYDASVLDDTTIANLVYRAGMTVGIGEGRPSKGDMGWGRFEVVNK